MAVTVNAGTKFNVKQQQQNHANVNGLNSNGNCNCMDFILWLVDYCDDKYRNWFIALYNTEKKNQQRNTLCRCPHLYI